MSFNVIFLFTRMLTLSKFWFIDKLKPLLEAQKYFTGLTCSSLLQCVKVLNIIIRYKTSSLVPVVDTGRAAMVSTEVFSERVHTPN